MIDTFWFKSEDGNDIIKDFKISEGDKIQLIKIFNEDNNVIYSSQGSNTVISWKGL